MELNLIFGRAGSGKTQYCIENLSEALRNNPDQKVFLIVPEQFTVEAEKRLLKSLDTGGLIQSEVLSFRRLSHWVLDKYGGVKKPILNGSGKAMALSLAVKKVSSKLEYYKKYAENPWVLGDLNTLMGEFLRNGVTEDSLESSIPDISGKSEELSIKIKELSLIYKEFRKILGEDYLDDISVHQIMMNNLKENKPFEDAVIWIDEFTSFSESENDIIRELITEAASVNVCLTYEKGNDLFAKTGITKKSLGEIAGDLGITIKEKEIKPEPFPRYTENKALEILQQRYGVYPTEKYDGPVENIKICGCADPFEEVYTAATEIQRLCSEEGLEFGDIAVTVRDMDSFRDKFESIFGELNIKYFLDNRRSLDSYSVAACILDALDIIANDFKNESVFSFLKSVCVGFDAHSVDYLENYTIKHGIYGNKKWERTIEDKPILEELRGRFMTGTVNLKKGFDEAETFSDVVNSIYEFIEYFGIAKYAEKFADTEGGNTEPYDAYICVEEVLSQIKDFLGETNIKRNKAKSTAEMLKNIMGNGFSNYSIGKIPDETDAVKIGSADRIRTGEIKALFILGANEGVFPSDFSDSGILSDNERTILEETGIKLAETLRVRAEAENLLTYTIVTAPKKYLYVFYSNFLDSKGAHPSRIVRRIKAVLENVIEIEPQSVKGLIKGKNNRERKNKAVPGAEAFIPEEYVNSLYPKNENRSVSGISGLETYASCPYKFLFSKGISAEEREKFGINPLNIGSFVHSLIENATAEIYSGNGTVPKTLEECRKVIDGVYEKSLDGSNFSETIKGDAKYEFFTDIIKETAGDYLLEIVNSIGDVGYKPDAFELSFGSGKDNTLPPLVIIDDDGNELQLDGRIDRLDVFEFNGKKYYRIVDYKTGSKKMSKDKIESGETMQPIAYLKKMLDQNSSGEPGGAFYCSLPLSVIKSKEETFSTNGILLKDEDSQKAMTERFSKNTELEKGEIELLFKTTDDNIIRFNKEIKSGRISGGEKYEPGTERCKYCPYTAICQAKYD